MKRQLHLNLFFHSRGHHEASWRHPATSPLALTDIRYYQDLAQRAEAALFDSIFLADQLALGEDVAQAARTWLEPITVLAALAVSTSRVGLIATASTTYTEPFNLARQFASIDHISNGRAAWNIVTSWLATAAENYGGDGQVSHADRYARGEEFMEVVKALWDSWAATRWSTTGPAGFMRARTAFGRSTTAVISTMWPGRSTCRAAHRDGRCWCRRDRPTPVAASPRGMPMPCSPLTWRRRRRRNSTPI